MDNTEQKNENHSDQKENPTSTETQEAAFKKPTLLIGKIGRFPRKLHTASTSKSAESVINSEKNTQEKLNVKPEQTVVKQVEPNSKVLPKDKRAPAQQQADNLIPLPYKEPNWSGLPETTGKPYVFEVLKNGTIIETIDLMKKPFWVFGRLANCDIYMQHPTISRYHLILQYRDTPSETDPPGFYLYDLGSTHGTFLNGKNNKLKPKIYVPIRVGHMIRLGCSQRSFILTGPEDDQEEESELSVTELKQLRAQKIKEHEEKMKQAELEREEKRQREEERGVDWGIGDDADETEDIADNPYASTNNEELYLDDPKKALRGFFEREGLELEYDCSEQGLGQFLCKVELPLDDEMGRPIMAEVLHRGKKKEAVIQCALEACRILDRFGVLRQATHESRKRKTKNWEEDDYYDSDEDTFLDRTGTIEKKREKRMKAKEPKKVETYDSLLEKEKEISKSISEIEQRLAKAQSRFDEANGSGNGDEDSLDSYMKGLQEHKPDRQTISKLKFELAQLKKEHANVIRLANIAKPADLPALVPKLPSANPGPSTSSGMIKQNKPGLPVVGKRKGLPVRFPAKPTEKETVQVPLNIDEVDEEESEEEDVQQENITNKNIDKEEQDVNMKNIEDHVKENDAAIGENDNSNDTKEEMEVVQNVNDNIENLDVSSDNEKTVESRTEDNSNVSTLETNNGPQSPPRPEEDNPQALSDSQSESEDSEAEARRASAELLELRPIKSFHETLTFKKFENIMKSGLPPFAGRHKEKLEKILNRLKRLASNEDRMHVDWKTLSAKKRKVMKLIMDLKQSESNEKLEYRVSSELNRILNELNTMTEEKFKVIGKVKKMGNELKNISIEIDRDLQALKNRIGTVEESADNSSDDQKAGSSNKNTETKDESGEVDDKKKKKNQKRIEQRQQKAEMERQRGYEEDATRENYSMWVPPNNQSGDGRTDLNDKYGY